MYKYEVGGWREDLSSPPTVQNQENKKGFQAFSFTFK